MKAIVSRSLFCLLIIFIFVSCNRGGSSQTSRQSETRTIKDMTGNEVIVPAVVERVFVDWPSGITLVMTLGAIDKLVTVFSNFNVRLTGVAGQWIPLLPSTEDLEWIRIISPELNNIESNDGAFSNIEIALSYNPDIVITNLIDNIQRYKTLGMTVIYVNFNDYESFKDSMMIIATVLGEKYLDVAMKYNKFFDDNIAMVTKRTNGLADNERPRVYYLDGRFPEAYRTVGTGEIQEIWISCAGGISATSGQFIGRNIEITVEQFLAIDPDIIMIGGVRQADAFDVLITDPILSGLSAVKNGLVYRIPQGIFAWCRTGPESAIHTIWAAQRLHPQLFNDIDILEITRDFYKEFFGTILSDNHLQGILNGQISPNGR